MIKFLSFFLVIFPLLANTQISKSKKPNPMLRIEDQPGLPRVLLIGDSISIGYTIPVRNLLKGKVNVHRIPTNGGPTIKGLNQIEAWIGKKKWDVIHFNWGLHDLKYMGPNGENLFPKEKGGKVQVDLSDYEQNLELLVRRLSKTGAKLICVTQRQYHLAQKVVM